MKQTLQLKKWQSVVEDVEVDLPEKAGCYWLNGVRLGYMVVPQWTTWNVRHKNKPEEIFEYKIIEVNPDGEIHLFQLSVSSLPEIMNDTKHPLNRLVNNFVRQRDENTRPIERFHADLNGVLEKVNALTQNPLWEKKEGGNKFIKAIDTFRSKFSQQEIDEMFSGFEEDEQPKVTEQQKQIARQEAEGIVKQFNDNHDTEELTEEIYGAIIEALKARK